MKKIFVALTLASLIVPVMAFAQAGPQECCKLRRSVNVDGTDYPKDAIVGPSVAATCDIGAVNNATTKWGVVCTINTLNGAVDWIFVILITLSVVLTIMGAFNLMMSAGDPGKVTEGRNYIMFAAIGLLAAFIARAIPSIVKAAIGY